MTLPDPGFVQSVARAMLFVNKEYSHQLDIHIHIHCFAWVKSLLETRQGENAY